jgi:hypothetical protein
MSRGEAFSAALFVAPRVILREAPRETVFPHGCLYADRRIFIGNGGFSNASSCLLPHVSF